LNCFALDIVGPQGFEGPVSCKNIIE